jgi:hypothetical protein
MKTFFLFIIAIICIPFLKDDDPGEDYSYYLNDRQ